MSNARSAGSDLSRRETAIWLVSILLVAGGLRFLGLEAHSLWNDELSSIWRTHYSTWHEVLQKGVLTDPHPPGYHFLLYWVQQLFGDSETAVRLPSAIFGWASVGLIFWAGARLASRRVGLFAAMLLGVSRFPVYYSQMARVYAALLFFSLVATCCWIEVLRRRTETGRLPVLWVVLYQLSSLGVMYSHYIGCLLIPLHAVLFVVWRPRRLRHVCHSLWVYVPIALGYLPWIPYFRQQPVADGKTPTDLTFPFEFVGKLLNGRYDVGELQSNSERLAVLLVVIVLLLLYTWPWYSRLYRRHLGQPDESIPIVDGAEVVLLSWFAVPMVVVMLGSYALRPMAVDYTLIYLAPAVYLLIARTWERLSLSTRTWRVSTALVGLAFVIDLIFVQRYYTTRQGVEFRGVVEYVVKNEPRTSDVEIAACAHNFEYFDYYFRRYGSPLRVTRWICEDGQDFEPWLRDQARAPRDTVWLLSAHLMLEPEAWDRLNVLFEVVDKKMWGKRSGVWKLKTR